MPHSSVLGIFHRSVGQYAREGDQTTRTTSRKVSQNGSGYQITRCHRRDWSNSLFGSESSSYVLLSSLELNRNRLTRVSSYCYNKRWNRSHALLRWDSFTISPNRYIASSTILRLFQNTCRSKAWRFSTIAELNILTSSTATTYTNSLPCTTRLMCSSQDIDMNRHLPLQTVLSLNSAEEAQR